jgi:glycosyltransferase involved in cell wall biosynthesis
MPERAARVGGAVAVLIPVYEDDGRLAGTLRSLEDQGVPTVAVIVDDGSTVPVNGVGSPDGVETVVLRHGENRGIERALNTGLEYIRRRGIAYIARLDAGDRCAPRRLLRQREFLDANPDVHLVGSAVEWRDDDERVRFTRRFPTTHEAIVRALRHTTVLIHPAVMFRASVMDSVGDYSTAYPAAEDYDFFVRIASRHHVANLAEVLVITRFDPNGLSMRRRRAQLRSTLRIQLRRFAPAEWTSYYGVLKTLGRFAVPYSWIVALKSVASGRGHPLPV